MIVCLSRPQRRPKFTAAAGGSNTPFASQYSLEILYPKAVGAAPNGLDSNNRCYFAYTGLDYTIRCAAIGGSYPYTWSLSNAPAGMSINASTGVITWTNPTTNATNITVTCTDSATPANTDSETWSITVGTSGWYFVDAVNGNNTTGTGSAAAPWQTLSKVYDSAAANSRVYLRAGTYTPAGITVTNADDINGEERIEWSNTARSTIFLRYPGDSRPIVDFEYAGTGYPYNTGASVPRFRMSGTTTCLIGLDVRNAMTMAFQMNRSSNRGTYVWDCTFDGMGPGIDGGNSAFIMYVATYGSGGTPGTQCYGDVVIGCTFNDISGNGTNGGGCTIKWYSCIKPLVDDCTITNSTINTEMIAPKADVSQFTIRDVQFSTIGNTAISGNMDTHNAASGEYTYGEVCYCYVADATTSGLDIGVAKIDPAGEAIGRVDVYRNTFVCPVRVQNLYTIDGPYVFSKNAIQNSDTTGNWNGIAETSINDATRVTLDDNTVGTAGIVDGSGNLVDTSKLGTHGHVIP